MSVTLIHTADWQLGKVFGSVEDPQKRALLQQERFNGVKRIAELARARSASLVVVAGDVFDSTTPSKATVAAACSAIGAIPCPVVVIPGNHDHAGPGSLWEQAFFQQECAALAPNLQVLTKPEPLACAGVLLFPCPLLRRHETGDPTAWVRAALADGADVSMPRVVLAHGATRRFVSLPDDEEAGDAGTNLIDLERLPASTYDYLALGDWHGRMQVAEKAWYSGTPEMDRFPKGEGHQQGSVLVVTTERGQAPQVEPVAVARFGWHTLEFALADDAQLDEVERQVAAAVGTRANEDLLRLELSGSLGIAAMNRLEALLDAWRARLLRVRLVNQTRIAPSPAELEGLVARPGDPLIASVAASLLQRAGSSGPESRAAAIALRRLHAACR